MTPISAHSLTGTERHWAEDYTGWSDFFKELSLSTQNRPLQEALTKISGTGAGKTSGCMKEGAGERMKEEPGGEVEEGDRANTGTRTGPF